MKKKKIWKVDTNSNSMKKVLQILKDPILFSKIMKLENQLQNTSDSINKEKTKNLSEWLIKYSANLPEKISKEFIKDLTQLVEKYENTNDK
jgi:hypothetical protein